MTLVPNQRFGRLVVLSTWIEARVRFADCLCDCGNTKIVRYTNLISGQTQSCGCLAAEAKRESGRKRRTHGMTNTDTYRYWTSLKKKGVLCADWQDFEAFYKDVGKRPADLFLARKDANQPFSKRNFAGWVDEQENWRQAKNARCITLGVTTKTVAEWAKEVGITRQAFQQWLDTGERSESDIEAYLALRRDAYTKRYSKNIKQQYFR